MGRKCLGLWSAVRAHPFYCTIGFVPYRPSLNGPRKSCSGALLTYILQCCLHLHNLVLVGQRIMSIPGGNQLPMWTVDNPWRVFNTWYFNTMHAVDRRSTHGEQVSQVCHDAVFLPHPNNLGSNRLTSSLIGPSITLCFFAIINSGLVVFFTTSLLSQETLAGPLIGTPNNRSFYRNGTSKSFAVGRATNSLPKLEDLTVFCRLKNQKNGAWSHFLRDLHRQSKTQTRLGQKLHLSASQLNTRSSISGNFGSNTTRTPFSCFFR